MPSTHEMNVKLPAKAGASRIAALAAWTVSFLLMTGCSRAPAFNILGSFFPDWILCGVLGILLTVVARILLVSVNFERDLAPLILIYPCMAAFFTFSIWLLFFR
jgi:hypothetical protein